MIEILLEHSWFLVINKPSGILTQAIPGIESVQRILIRQLRLGPDAPVPFVGVPHRLDRGTSGAMVLARNQRALRRLSEQFAARTVKKEYHAITPRWRQDEEAIWHDWMRKTPEQAKAELVSSETEGAKEAVLKMKCLKHFDLLISSTSVEVSLIELLLETGRMHQIRLQCASRGVPILGDSLYGSTIPWAGHVLGERESPIALHARTISFRHPQTAEQISVTAPYPSEWPDYISR